MLAARDQENLVHARQTAAAGKPLNQGVRALHAKTPGGLKTPFRTALHDENRPFELKGQKTAGKDGPSKLDKNSFVTPFAPRNRAPLGAKTTNVKAQAFQTPAPAPLTTRQGPTVQRPTTARRSGRSKIAVASSEPIQGDVLTRRVVGEEPDFGYAPPPPTELPDPPLDFSEDPLLTEELLKGYGELYGQSPQDKHEMSLRRKREEAEYTAHQKKQEQEILDSWNTSTLPTGEELDRQVDAMIAAGPKKKGTQVSRVDTMKARSAVAALSELQSRPPSAAMKSTQASEQKKKGVTSVITSKRPTVPQPSRSTQPRGTALSKNTIGFPKAKKAPSIIPAGVQDGTARSGSSLKPQRTSHASIHPKDFRDLYGSPPVESEMWFRLKEYELLEQDISKENTDELEDELFNTELFPFENSKLDHDDFQLPMPE